MAGWLRGWQARAHLLNSAGLARELSAQVVGGDTARAQRTLAALQEQSGSARAATGDPGWWVGRHAPYAGDNLAAVRQISVAIDDLARRAFPPLLRADLTSLVPAGGRLDVGRLRALSAELARVNATVQGARDSLATVPTEGLVGQVRQALGDLRGEIDRLAGLTAAADEASRLLPGLLGADGPRTYLVVSQNPAELRATGGMIGGRGHPRGRRPGPDGAAGHQQHAGPVPAAAEGAHRGAQPLGRPARDLSGRRQPHPALPDRRRPLPGDVPPAYGHHRGRGARRRPGGAVVSAQGHGPGDGARGCPAGRREGRADGAQRQLPADDNEEQDAFFAASAAAVFDALVTKNVDPKALKSPFDRAVTERRILFWSARNEEQRRIGDSRLAGALPEKDTVPTVGVFLNDGSGAKLGYYLRPSATLAVGDCRPDGRRGLRLRVTLRSSAPKSGLSESVLGLGLAGDPYTVRTLVSVHSPAGGCSPPVWTASRRRWAAAPNGAAR